MAIWRSLGHCGLRSFSSRLWPQEILKPIVASDHFQADCGLRSFSSHLTVLRPFWPQIIYKPTVAPDHSQTDCGLRKTGNQQERQKMICCGLLLNSATLYWGLESDRFNINRHQKSVEFEFFHEISAQSVSVPCSPHCNLCWLFQSLSTDLRLEFDMTKPTAAFPRDVIHSFVPLSQKGVLFWISSSSIMSLLIILPFYYCLCFYFFLLSCTWL